MDVARRGNQKFSQGTREPDKGGELQSLETKTTNMRGA
jgi:hypothetical protein